MRLQCPPHRGGSSTRARRACLYRGVRKASSGGPAWPPGTGPAARHAPEPRSRTSCSTWLGLGLGLVRVRVRVRGRVRAVGLRLGVRLGFKVRVRARTGRVVSTTRACRGTSAWKPPAYMAKAKAAGMRTQPSLAIWLSSQRPIVLQSTPGFGQPRPISHVWPALAPGRPHAGRGFDITPTASSRSDARAGSAAGLRGGSGSPDAEMHAKRLSPARQTVTTHSKSWPLGIGFIETDARHARGAGIPVQCVVLQSHVCRPAPGAARRGLAP